MFRGWWPRFAFVKEEDFFSFRVCGHIVASEFHTNAVIKGAAMQSSVIMQLYHVIHGQQETSAFRKGDDDLSKYCVPIQVLGCDTQLYAVVFY